MTDVLVRLLAVAVGMLVVAVVGRAVVRRDGRVRTSPVTPATPAAPTGPTLSVDHQTRLGLDPTTSGPRAVLFGSPTCAPCVTVKAVLGELVTDRPDLTWSYVDAADHLDVADEHKVRRVPTLLVIDRDGTIVTRASGVPDRHELLAALPA